MKRRELLLNAAALGAWAGLSQDSFAREGLEVETSFSGRVLIVGGGAAGLYAALVLGINGIPYTILESRESLGGRMRADNDFCDFTIDLGAEWMHGQRSLLGDLARDNGVRYFEDTSEAEFWYRGRLSTRPPRQIRRLMAGVLDGDEDDVSVAEYAREEWGFDDDLMPFLEYFASDYGASADRLSVKWAAVEEEEWSSGERDFKFADSLASNVIRLLGSAAQDRTVFGCDVTAVEHGSEVATVRTRDGRKFQAERVIVSVPITQLQKQAIKFVPPIPPAQQTAMNRIGIEPGMKIFLKFRKKFYRGNVVGGPVCPLYFDAAFGKASGDHVLVGFVMGKTAQRLSDMGEAAVDALLDELTEMYGPIARQSFEKSLIQDWSKEAGIGGAYSYAPVGMTANARRIAARPLGDQVYFAGEAMNVDGHHQSVHGALETGRNAVLNILGAKS